VTTRAENTVSSRRIKDAALWQRVLIGVGLFALIVNGVYPMVWILLTSFKTELELTTKPLQYLPKTLSVQNYVEVFRAQPFGTYFLNSIIVAGLSTVLCVFVAALAAYGLARLRLRGHRTYTILVTVCSMFPVVSLIVPLFQIMRGLNLLNTYPGLIIPYAALSLPIAILTLTAFFQSIPEDLEAAAMVDGCSRLGALWRIIVPLAAPGVVTAGILTFVNSWNEFLLALTFNSSREKWTVPVGVINYQGEFSFPWPLISAAIVITIVPVVILIIVFQRRIIGGLTAGSVKG
jgi:multiple sugar transport system permease protein